MKEQRKKILSILSFWNCFGIIFGILFGILLWILSGFFLEFFRTWILYMISNDTNFGFEKILGLVIDKKRSLEARADAFSRLKRIEIYFYFFNFRNLKIYISLPFERKECFKAFQNEKFCLQMIFLSKNKKNLNELKSMIFLFNFRNVWKETNISFWKPKKVLPMPKCSNLYASTI